MNYSTLSEVSLDLNEWKDEFPYKLVCDNDWKFLWSYLQNDKHPIAYLILERFRIRNYLLNNISRVKKYGGD